MTYPNRYTQQKFATDYGNYIDRERRESRSAGNFIVSARHLRYCEAGEHYVKRTGGAVNKGWKCRECRDAKAHS